MKTPEKLCKICNKSKRYKTASMKYAHPRCKACFNRYYRERRQTNQRVRNQSIEYGRKRVSEFKELMELAKSHPCKDCGIKYPTFVMEFDHLPQFKKKFNISCGAFKTQDQLREEMLKCELVCANCHRVRTHGRR